MLFTRASASESKVIRSDELGGEERGNWPGPGQCAGLAARSGQAY
jgi:hypothetical protein